MNRDKKDMELFFFHASKVKCRGERSPAVVDALTEQAFVHITRKKRKVSIDGEYFTIFLFFILRRTFPSCSNRTFA